MSGDQIGIAIERWPTAAVFRITGHVWTEVPVLVVTITRDGHVGRGEACGVYYRGETGRSMLTEGRELAATSHASLDRESLLTMIGPGGVRNAFDCALWELESLFEARPVWALAKVPTPKPLLTTYTLGAESPGVMAQRAVAFSDARALKLKLNGDDLDAERVRAVRTARRDVWLAVDANQGFTPEKLDRLMPTLLEAGVELIEQPFPAGQDHLLDRLESPIAIAADESAQDVDDIARLVGRVDIVNIKLDKCGGLTRGLEMARAAQRTGMRVMVGNMLGTSLSMAPSFVLGQLCDIVDLDGPLQLLADREEAVTYSSDGHIWCPEKLWGAAALTNSETRT